MCLPRSSTPALSTAVGQADRSVLVRVVITLVVLALALGWGSYRLRKSAPEVSQVLLGFCVLVVILFSAAFFEFL